MLLSREFRGFGGRNTAPEYTPGPFGSGRGTDEIEMELPEGTDGLTGFQTRRKIKTRANGCEGESFTKPPLSHLPPFSVVELYFDRTEGLLISEQYLKGFRARGRDDTFFKIETGYNVKQSLF